MMCVKKVECFFVFIMAMYFVCNESKHSHVAWTICGVGNKMVNVYVDNKIKKI